MDNKQSDYHTKLVVAVLTWLGTWVLVIPAGMQFPKAGSLCGAFWAMSVQTRALTPLENAAVDYSLYLGILIMLAASAIVMWVAREHKRTVYVVAMVDFIVAAVPLLVAWYFSVRRS